MTSISVGEGDATEEDFDGVEDGVEALLLHPAKKRRQQTVKREKL